MHKQSKQILIRFSRKRVLLFVLIFSMVILGSAIYWFTAQNNWLENEFANQIQSTVLKSKLLLAASILLFFLVIYLLLVKIRKSKNLSNDLYARKEMYRVTLNSLGEGLIRTDRDGHVQYMNATAERLTGWSWQDAKNQPIHSVYKIVNEETGKPFENIVSRIIEGGKKVEWENNTLLKAKGSGTYIISNNGSQIFDIHGNISGVVLVFDDITEKYRTEKQLRDSEKQYRNLIQNLPEAVYTCDAEGYIKLYNKAAVELWGLEPVPGKDLWCGSWKIFNKDGTDLQLESCPMAICLKEGMPVHGKEYIVQRPDETYRHVLPYPSPLFDAEGQLTGAVNMLIDVTDKKEREMLIQNTEEKYRNMIEQASDAILIYSFDGTIHEFNKSCYTLLGYTAEEYAKLNLTDILVGDIIVNQENYAAILAGETKTLYRHLMRKDGSLIETEVTVKMLANGKMIAFARDITERKKVELAIKKEKELSDSVINSLPGVFCMVDENVKFVRWNKNFETFTGYSADEIARMHPTDLFHQDEKGKIVESIGKVFEDGEVHVETSFYTKEHEVIPYYFNGYKIDYDGRTHIIGIGIDSTERKKAGEDLRMANQRLTYHLNNSPLAIIEWDKHFIVQGWSAQAENIFGWNKAEVVNKHFNDLNLVFEEDAPAVGVVANELMTGAVNSNKCLNRNNTKLGDVISCQWFNSVLKDEKGNIQSILSLIQDITEQKTAEEEIKIEKQLSDSVINCLPGVFYFYDENQKLLRWNKQLENITGYSAAELGSINPIDFFEGEDKKYMQERSRKVFASGSGDAEACFTTKSGKKIPFYFTGLRMQYEGKPGLLGIGIDVTERKNAETKTKQAIERYDILADATSDTIWDWDMVNNKMLYNDGINKMFGYPASEVENLVDWWNEKLHPDDFQKVTESLDDIFEKGQEKFQLTYRFRSADGSYKHIFDRAVVIFDENHKPSRMIGAMQDITYQIEEEMRISKAILDAQEQERNHLGAELHDNINQILAGSLLTLGMAKSKEADPRQQTGFIESAMGHINDAISETRKLSHSLAPASFQETSLEELFETLLFNINLDNRFAISLYFEGISETVFPDDVQLNLYRILQEQTKNIIKYAEASEIEIAVTVSGDNVTLRIFDNGKGFNTKTSKKGIGLNNIKKRAESLSGKLILNSAPGKGCELIVEVPLDI